MKAHGPLLRNDLPVADAMVFITPNRYPQPEYSLGSRFANSNASTNRYPFDANFLYSMTLSRLVAQSYTADLCHGCPIREI
jgi:hypothetical protein